MGLVSLAQMRYAAGAWTCPGIRVTAEPITASEDDGLPVSVTNDGKDLNFLYLRWAADMTPFKNGFSPDV